MRPSVDDHLQDCSRLLDSGLESVFRWTWELNYKNLNLYSDLLPMDYDLDLGLSYYKSASYSITSVKAD